MNGFFGRKINTPHNNTQRALSRLMLTSALVAVGTMALSSSVMAADPWSDMTGAGFAKNSSGGVTNIAATTKNGKASGTGNLDILAGQTVNIDATLFVARDNRPTITTQILGNLNSTGTVVLVDRNGIVFGKDSRVDVGSLIATTGDIDDAKATASGKAPLLFTNIDGGEIVNGGTIAASGLVAFVAPTVKNSGTINVNVGSVSLAAGKTTATVDLYGDGLVEFATASLADTGSKLLSENTGSITAPTIRMTAAAAKDLADSVVNMQGVLNATHAKLGAKGQIILSANKVVVAKPTAKTKASVTGNTKIYAQSADIGLTIDGTVGGSAAEVNILSNDAKIAQGLDVVSTGGTVNVASGTYDEHLVVSKNGVTLKGANAGKSANGARVDETIINPNSPGVTITGSNVTVDGFTFAGAMNADGYGIFVNNANSATIKNNIINGTSQYGVYLLKSANALLKENLILNTGSHGIFANASDFLQIISNQIGIMKGANHNINGDGIQLVSSDNAYIYNNRISNTTTPIGTINIGNGIQVINSDETTLIQNTIYNVDWDGIRIAKSTNTKVFDNDIHHATRVGVYATASSNVDIYNNQIDNTTLRGVELHQMAGQSTVTGNRINASKSDGIWVRSSDDVLVDGNKIGYGLDGLFNTKDDSIIAGNGILITDSNNVKAINNLIAHTGISGIYASNALGLQIGNYFDQNNINFTGSTGLYVVNSTGAKIIANQVGVMKAGNNNIKGDGILVENSNGVVIDKNRVAKTTATTDEVGSGIHVENSDNATIIRNTAYNTAWDGIKIGGGTTVNVLDNIIENVTRAGIYARDASDVTFANNNVSGTGLVGLMVQDLFGPSTISGNFVNSTGMDAIRVLRADTVTIDKNTIGYGLDKALGADDTIIQGDGIRVQESSDVSVTNNKIVNAAENGVHIIDGYGLITVATNLINDSAINGILAESTTISTPSDEGEGDGGGSVEEQFFEKAFFVSPLDLHIDDNTVSNGAAVQGFAAVNLDIGGDGVAELSGNTLGDNFEYGLYALSGQIDLTSTTKNTIQNTGTGLGFYASLADPTTLRLVDNTIGQTAFVDQTNLFVDLGEQTFFAPDSPTFIDGNNATYTVGGVTISPSANGGFVTSDEYDTLELMINHYNDSTDRGLFFFNVLPTPVFASFLIDQKDVLRDTFGVPTPNTGRGNLTITGLPSIGLTTTTTGGFNPALIEPAAGDESADGTTPTAGDVANIQPAAGNGSEAGCWADAMTSLGQGAPVTFNFGSEGTALLQGTANCGTGQGQSL